VAAVRLVLDDLAPFADIPPAKAQAMIDDVTARAARVAPASSTPTSRMTLRRSASCAA
jgi:hypothetical protein